MRKISSIITPNQTKMWMSKVVTIIGFAVVISLVGRLVSVASAEGTVTEFDALPEEQKAAAIKLLSEAMRETNTNPLELIRLGLENAQKKKSSLEEKTTVAPASLEAVAAASTLQFEPFPYEPAPVAAEVLTTVHPTKTTTTTTATTTSVLPTTNPPFDLGSSQTIPSSTESVRELTVPPQVAFFERLFKEKSETPLATIGEAVTTEPLSSSPKESTTFSPPSYSGGSSLSSTPIQDQHSEHEQAERGAPINYEQHVEHVARTTQSPPPPDEDFEDVYIDRSDPNNPKKVHVRRKIKSTVDSNGYSHEHSESQTSSSLSNNPNSYSHSSSSYSSSSSGSGGKPVGNWAHSSHVPAVPSLRTIQLQSMPMMPSFQSMPVIPFTWPSFYGGQVYQDYTGYANNQQPQAFASAFAGVPETSNLDFPIGEGYLSKKQLKKLKRSQERASRLAMDYDFGHY